MSDDRAPDWGKWRDLAHVKVWEAVALSLNIEPAKVKHSPHGWMADRHLFEEGSEFNDRMELVCRNLGTRHLPFARDPDGSGEQTLIRLLDFLTWFTSLGAPIPQELKALKSHQLHVAGQVISGAFSSPQKMASAPVIHASMTIPPSPQFLTVAEIPPLMAMAVYPRPEAGTETEIIDLTKQGLSDDSRPEPIDASDWAQLDAIWATLEPLALPMFASKWQPYADLADKETQKLGWRLVPTRRAKALEQAIKRATLEDEYHQQLSSAIRAGELLPLNPVTRLPSNFTQGTAGANALVTLEDFAKFAKTMGIAVAVEGEHPEPAKDGGNRPGSPIDWPWGEHHTELLGWLAEAGRQFWSTYDPDQPATAPTNADVQHWLEGKGVAKRVAEVMAQILRADGLITRKR